MQAICPGLHNKYITPCDTFSSRPEDAFRLCLESLPREEAIILKVSMEWPEKKKIIGELEGSVERCVLVSGSWRLE